MPEDYTAYLDPGIYVDEIPSPVVANLGIAPTVMGLVGDSQRYTTNTEVVQLNATTGAQLSKLGVDTATITVKDRFTGTTYTATTDYTVTTGTGADAQAGTLDDTTTLARVALGTIPDGSYVTVSYRYTDPTYYNIDSYIDYDEVRDQFGDPFTSSGSVNSPLTLAAYLAFRNGARELIISPVKAAAASPSTQEWQTAVDGLRNYPQVNVIVPVTGDSSVHDTVHSHVTVQSNNGNYRRAFVGRSAATTITELKSQSNSFNDPRMTVVGPSSVEFFEGNSQSRLTLGGEYLAVAVAASHASRAVQIPLTRKTIRGFFAIPERMTEQQMLDAQRAGLLLLWQKRTGEIVVRHGLTTDMSNIYSREISVQAAKDRLMTLVFETLDRQGVIGSVMTEETPEYVAGTVGGALEFAKGDGLITDYSGLKYRVPTSNPTLLEIRFQYKPALPLNYIQVQFAIDTNTGMAEFVEAEAV